MKINPHGIWESDSVNHYFDKPLADAIIKLVYPNSVIDLGCGQKGLYVQYFLNNKIKTSGYDGNPSTEITTKGICKVADLAIPQNFPIADWVVCLEVAEHIPSQFQNIFLDNLANNKLGIILSWATPNQGGNGHVNEKKPKEVIEIMAERKYALSVSETEALRSAAHLDWFKKNISVFRRT